MASTTASSLLFLLLHLISVCRGYHLRHSSQPETEEPHRQLGTGCSSFTTCSGAGGLTAALKAAALAGHPLKVCPSSTPIDCRTTKNSGPSVIAFGSSTSPTSAVLECASNNLGAEGGMCIMDLSPGEGLDPLAAAYSAIFLANPGNSVKIRGFQLSGVRGNSRVAYLKTGASITFRECIFTDNHHKDGNTPVLVYDWGTPIPTTRIEHSFIYDNVGELVDFQSGIGILVNNIFYNNRAVPDQKTSFLSNKEVVGSSFELHNNTFLSNDSTGARSTFWLVHTEDPQRVMDASQLLEDASGNCASENFMTGTYASIGITECHNGIYTKGKWPYSCTNMDACLDTSLPPLPCDAFRSDSCSTVAVTSSTTPAPVTAAPSDGPTMIPSASPSTYPSIPPTFSSSPTGIVIHAQPTQPSSEDECSPLKNFEGCGHDPLHFYIDPTNGNDENSGESLQTAIRSISRAIEIANTLSSVALVFHLAGGYYGEFGVGPWTNPLTERASAESWIQFIASTEADGANPVVFSNVEINHQDPLECRLVIRGARINGTAPGSSGDNNAIEIRRSSHVRIHECIVDPQNLDIWEVFEKIPQGLFTREASNVILSSSEIIGGRYGVVFAALGRYLQVIDCDIHHQFEDAIRIASVEDVVMRGNRIHHVDDYQNTLQHIDGIQFFPSGPSGSHYYPQSHNVLITENVITDMIGQMIFIQANYVDMIGYMYNITVSKNVLGPKTVIDSSVPIQVQGVKDFHFQSNTVVGTVLVRHESSGILLGNIFGKLGVAEDASILHGSDYNVLGEVQVSTENVVELGSSIISTTTYGDVAAFDFAPTSIDACSGGINGLHAGAVSCRLCETSASSGPIASFAIHPSRLEASQAKALLIPSSSVICGGSNFSLGSWTVSDSQTSTFSSLDETKSVCFPSPGIYSVEYTLTDTNGAEASLSKHAIRETPAKEGLVARLPLSSSLLADISPNKHDSATFTVPDNSTFESDGCAFDTYIHLGYEDHIVLPSSVRNSVNLKSGLTAALWAKPSSPGQLLYKHVTVGIWIESASRVYFAVGTNANATHNAWFRENAATATGFDSFDGQWHHYAVTFNGTDIFGYIDGTLMASGKVPLAYASGQVRDGNWDMMIGYRPWKARNFVGGVKDFRLFDQELDGDEILALASDTVNCEAHALGCPGQGNIFDHTAA